MVDFVINQRADARTFNLYEFANGTAEYSEQTSTSFRIDYVANGVNKTSFVTGFGFQYFPEGTPDFAGAPSTGTTTSVANYTGEILNATISGLSISTPQAFAYIQSNNPQAVAADVFRGDDTITASSFDDYLDGYGGADTFRGGGGSDTYLLDNAGDRVFEGANAGTDTIISSVTQRLGANVENLTLTGSGDLSGTGNNLDNVIIGNSGVNVLRGGDGNDTLDGGGGRDRLDGGAGDDTYIVNDIGVRVLESADGGTDTIVTSLSTTLAIDLENLSFTGNANLYGTGNAANNVITGNGGNNVLSGGDGNDTIAGNLGSDRLIGGGGSDTFVFNTVQDSTFGAGRDLITDFFVSADSTLADKLDFSGIADFDFIDGSTFTSSGVAELRFARAGGNTVVEGDVNGDGAAEFSVLLRGVLALADNNIVG